MQSLFLFITFFVALAGQVLAFDIPVGNSVFKSTQLLTIPDSPVKTACAANCTSASAAIAACNDDTACLCRAETFTGLVACETCMLHYLIATNTRAPDPRAGSNVVVGGYVAACKTANPTLGTIAAGLSLPANWDGPLVSILPVGGVVVTVIVGVMLGGSAILLLSNM